MKLWDLSTQHCVQTIVAHRAEVWSLDLNPEQGLILSGSNEGELKAWKIEPGSLADGIRESEGGEVRFCLEFLSLPHISRLAVESNLPCVNSSPRFAPSCFSDRISCHTSVFFRPIKRPFCRSFPCADRRRNTQETRPQEKTG